MAPDRPPESGKESKAYEPPKIEFLGTLRDVLGKSGGRPDWPPSNPNQRRPL